MTTRTSDELDAIAAAVRTADRTAQAGRHAARRGADLGRQAPRRPVRPLLQGRRRGLVPGAQATHAGHIESGGVGKDVTFVDETDPGLGDALDAAYRR